LAEKSKKSSKIMDKNGRIGGKLSLIDLFAMLLLVALIAGGIWRFTAPAAQINPGEVTVRYTLRVPQARDFVVQYYQVGLPVFDRHTNLYIGTITDVRTMPRYNHEILPDGTVVSAPQPGIVVIYIDIIAEGRETHNAVFVGGTREINVGGSVLMRSKYVDVETTVSMINIIR